MNCEARPKINGFDRLREERHLLVAENVVINVDKLFSTRYVHANYVNSIRIWLR